MIIRLSLSRFCAAATMCVLAAATSPAAEDPAPGGGIHDQLVITLPDGWSVYDQTEAVTGKPSALGIVIFSALPLTKGAAKTPDVETMVKVDTGELASFFVDRKKADKGMKCEKLSRTTVYDLGTMLNQDASIATAGRRLFGGGLEPSHTDVEIGGCRGVRFVLQAHEKEPAKHRVVDVRAVSDGTTLYLFSLRNRGEHYAANLEALERAVASVRFASVTKK